MRSPLCAPVHRPGVGPDEVADADFGKRDQVDLCVADKVTRRSPDHRVLVGGRRAPHRPGGLTPRRDSGETSGSVRGSSTPSPAKQWPAMTASSGSTCAKSPSTGHCTKPQLAGREPARARSIGASSDGSSPSLPMRSASPLAGPSDRPTATTSDCSPPPSKRSRDVDCSAKWARSGSTEAMTGRRLATG